MGLCTGRSYAVLHEEILSLFSKDAFHIVSGGGQVISSAGEVLWSKELASEVVKSVYEVVDAQGGQCGFGVGKVFYANESLYKKMNPAVSEVPITIPNHLQNWQTPYIFVAQMNDEIREFLYTLADVNIKNMTNYEGKEYCDITVAGVNKAVAAKQWAQLAGIDLEEIIAVGDSLNDFEVLQVVGHGVAMGNALPEIKKIADQIIGHTDDDGLAKYLETFL